jgi:hypothetical protein
MKKLSKSKAKKCGIKVSGFSTGRSVTMLSKIQCSTPIRILSIRFVAESSQLLLQWPCSRRREQAVYKVQPS